MIHVWVVEVTERRIQIRAEQIQEGIAKDSRKRVQ